MRVSPLILLAVALPAAAQTPAKRTIEFTGLVLVNGFYNSAHVANVDLPLLADTDNVGVKSAGGSIRQTRLGVLLTDPDVLGGSFAGEVDADFYGGQQPSSGGRTFPLLRLRRITGTVTWPHAELLIGQEAPLVAGRSPRSLAAIGFPDFSGSGNLWLWIPQVRFTVEAGYTLRLAFQGAVLAPTTGTAQPAFFTQADSAERTARPELEGRLRLGWGATDDPSEIAVGGHLGWIKNLDSLTGDSILTSRALTVDTRFKIGIAEIVGEAFTGRALAGLGGGGIGQNFGVQGVPVRTKGGWAQLNIRPTAQWMFGGGGGIDDPNDADVLATGRFRNVAVEGHVEWRPPGPLVFGFEFRRLQTRYAAGDFAVNHMNLAAGYRF